jgi:predicted nucleotide-binding protein (sugar kinase/HSP70/actin superfamily)
MVTDLLQEALYDVRPVETRRGAADALHKELGAELLGLLEKAAQGDLSGARTLLEVASGRLFGVMDFLSRAAREFAAIKGDREIPTVLLVGEIYVRCDPFANDFIVDKLEARGIRARFAPLNEWLEYSDLIGWREGRKGGLVSRVSSTVQRRIQKMTYAAMAIPLRWPKRTTVEESLRASHPYVRGKLEAETVLTLGGPLHEWREGIIDAVLSVGPLECMPNKIAESQFFHVAEKEGLLSLTLSLNGDPIDPEVVDNFAFEVHSRFQRGARRVARACATEEIEWGATETVPTS